jgi:hypothetical protein
MEPNRHGKIWAIPDRSDGLEIHSCWKLMSGFLLYFERRSKGTFPTDVLSSDLPLRAFDIEGVLDTHVFAIKVRPEEVLKLLSCFDL